MEDTSHRNLQGKPEKWEKLNLYTHTSPHTHMYTIGYFNYILYIGIGMCIAALLPYLGICPDTSYLYVFMCTCPHVLSQTHTLRFDRHNIFCQ